MIFLNAWAAGFAAIAPVIVLLYLLKLKRRPMPVSTLIFWQRILQEQPCHHRRVQVGTHLHDDAVAEADDPAVAIVKAHAVVGGRQ